MVATPLKTNLKEKGEKTNNMDTEIQTVDIPMMKDYIAAAEKKIKEELKDGKVSVEYELAWKPEDKNVDSGARRSDRTIGDYKYVLGKSGDVKELDLNLLKERIKELEANTPQDKNKIEIGKEVLHDIETWKPKNEYYGQEQNYHTQTKKYTEKEPTANIKKAIEDYQEFADTINKHIRKNPIRNIYYKTVYRPDGTGGLTMYWNVRRQVDKSSKDDVYYYRDDHYYVRHYDIAPHFKFTGGDTVKKVEEREEEERKKEAEEEARKKKAAEKKEADPRTAWKKEINDLDDEFDKELKLRNRYTRGTPEFAKHEEVMDEIRRKQVKIKDKIREHEKQLKKEKSKTEEGAKIDALKKEKKKLENEYYKLDYKKDKERKTEISERIKEIEAEIKELNKMLKNK